MIDFNNIVKKLLKKSGNVIFKKDIFDIIDPEKKDKYKSRLDKVIYNLKNKWVIIAIKSGVYIIPTEEDKLLNRIDLIEKYYIRLLKKYISYFVGASYYISWNKALEIHDKNYSIPEKIFIINRSLNKKIIIWDYEVIFKTISYKKDKKNINLYSKFSKFVEIKKIENVYFKVSSLELSLLESAVLWSIDESLNIKLIKKILKKYRNNFDNSVFYEVGKYKYIMSFNRLKELSKNIDEGLYMIFLDIIKKNWGLFIGEGLRGF